MPLAAVPFGNYLLLERLAIGGMAEVYLAKSGDPARGEQLVAVKRILPTIAEDHEFVAMFIDEAKIAGQLNHGNIARIFDLGKIHSSYFIAMEYVAGTDLRSLWDLARQDGGLPLPMVCHVVTKICEGLDYAHRRRDNRGRPLSIIHRDISPQNVLLSFEGDVKIIDFGIAKAAGRAVKTQTGVLKGKFAYMAPEQARGGAIDHRVDIFACGVILYELCTGERLYQAENDLVLLDKVRRVDIVPPSRLRPELAGSLERIVLRALAPEVEARYAWASAMQADLERFVVAQDMRCSRDDLADYVRRHFTDDYQRELERAQAYHLSTPPADASRVQPQPELISEPTTAEGGIAASPDVTQVQASPFEGEADQHSSPTDVVDTDAMLAEASGLIRNPERGRHTQVDPVAPDSGLASSPRLDRSRTDDPELHLPTIPTRAPRSLSRSGLVVDADDVDPNLEAAGDPDSGRSLVPAPLDLPAVARTDEEESHPGERGSGPPPVEPQAVMDRADVLIDERRPPESPRAPKREAPAGGSDWDRRLAAVAIPTSRLRLAVAYGAGVLTVLVILVGLRLIGGAPSGHLVVVTDPLETQVVVDDQDVKPSTPALFTLGEGGHRVSLARSGVPPVERAVTIVAGQVVMLQEVMPGGTGSMDLHSDPDGAQVLLDGKDVGVTPLSLPELEAERSHTLLLSHKLALDVEQKVTLSAGENRELTIALPYRVSRVVIQPTPADAVLYWDDRWRRSNTIAKVAHGQASRLLVRRPGCQDHTEEVTPRGERELVVAPVLVCRDIAAGGTLSVTGPYRARVVIEDIDVGRVPLLAYPLPAGRFELELRGRKGTSREAVEIAKGVETQIRTRVR